MTSHFKKYIFLCKKSQGIEKNKQEEKIKNANLIRAYQLSFKLLLLSDNPDIPQRTGKLHNVEKFDSQFFGLLADEARNLDPMATMLLEHAYEAIIDAGVNPRQLRGTNTGVFISSCFSESENHLLYSKDQVSIAENSIIC